MDRFRKRLAETRQQYLLFVLLSLAILGCAGVLASVDPSLFRPYFGGLDPMAAILGVSLLGMILVTLVLSRGWFAVYTPGPLRERLSLAVILPTLLAVGMILVDIVAGLPADINVPIPDSVLFYPTMGFVVEILFHLLPFSLVFLVVPSLASEPDRSLRLWVVLVTVGLLEPAFQLWFGFSEAVPLWSTVYVGLNVFAINLTQLYLFERYDFLTMYAFRLVYYTNWHVVWGIVRLEILF
ncbi:hypothetical protein GJR96_04095 [Haloferax sp. MBLA0076]|uniref:CPBP family intramembrane metalloprotease n=1 Tax=Haloferax litoreum TaxID=2666140 RepID=A0A6A8GD96_9EURY|nr:MULTISPECIES: hypothetical protein [Haloferax]KAB1192662.1 hypothetical protein Hfx1148_04085 [Haloferax sp. CBA1148]MRX21138.1 hypothetical protein [Haloferax litoreum]